MVWFLVVAGNSTLDKNIDAIERGGEYKKNPTLADSLASLHLKRCEARSSVKDCDRALELYNTYVKDSHNKQLKAIMTKGRVHTREGNYEAALTTYREAIGRIGKQTDWEKGGIVELTTNVNLLLAALGDYYLVSGLMDLQKGNYEAAAVKLTSAIKYLRKAGDYDYDLAKALHSRGIAYCHSGKIEEAIKDLTEAVEILNDLLKSEPRNEAVAYELGMALYHLGNAYVKKGNHEKAAELYAQASDAFMGIGAWDKSAKIVLAVGRSKVKRGEALHRAKKFKEALTYYKEGIKHLKKAEKLCKKDRRHCPFKGEIKKAEQRLNQAKKKKELQ
ncbi:MAG: tetratricopeptide repeat protein [Thermotogae bacterium]|nr:tetratricopeptide repeat protein [Thermotogota bacterium]